MIKTSTFISFLYRNIQQYIFSRNFQRTVYLKDIDKLRAIPIGVVLQFYITREAQDLGSSQDALTKLFFFFEKLSEDNDLKGRKRLYPLDFTVILYDK